MLMLARPLRTSGRAFGCVHPGATTHCDCSARRWDEADMGEPCSGQALFGYPYGSLKRRKSSLRILGESYK